MKRIGIYGGTFNPPHMGHILGAEYAREALDLDRVFLVPDGVPHKRLPENTVSVRDRLKMTGLAVGEREKLAVWAALPDYACHTVERFREAHPEAELFLILGSDMLETFPKWFQAEAIARKTTLAVLHRGGKEESAALIPAMEAVKALGAKVTVLDNPVTEISSTQLRRLLVFGCADPFLPEGVAAYIRENGLYGSGEDYRGLSMEDLERVVIGLLNPNRVAHVLGCRDTAVELALRYGVDPVDAARAALLHDVTKALDGPLQLTLCREYGTILDGFSQKNPKTLHALTGSLVAERIFGENSAVVDAIRCHTTGKADMNLLEKIIYVADYMEPNRDFPGVEKLRALAYEDITRALELGLRMTLEMLMEQGREISPESREALRYLTAGG